MRKLSSFINTIRYNGTARLADKSQTRHIIYMNMIWLATYLNFIIYSIVIFLVQPFMHQSFALPILVLHAGFLIIYLMVRYGYFNLTRNLFILWVYAMICYSDILFGKSAYNQIFYFAFLPTAFNVFSIKENKGAIIFYLALIPALLFFSELFVYKQLSISSWAAAIENKVRLLNIISGFLLTVLYSGFMILNTGRKQDKLIVQTGALQTTLNNALGAIWTIDKDYRIIVHNDLFAGFAAKEFGIDMQAGYNIKSILNKPEVPQEIREPYRKALRGEHVLDEINFRNNIYEVKGEPVFDDKGEIAGATFTSRNVTHIKEAQEFLVKAKQDAEKSAENRTLFLSNMSHELRTPLNGLIGLTNIMLSENDPVKQKQHLELMNNLSGHMMLLINNILDYTKIEAGKVTLEERSFNLQHHVKKLLPMFNHSAQAKQIGFDTVFKGNCDLFLKGDPVRLNQVLINLLGNAIKFTEKGGVKLIVEVPELQPETHSRVHFLVEDSGIGIHKDNLDKIFESFTQADTRTTRKFGGTGLGLTIAENILKMMDSRLEVKSELNKGSVFGFTVNFLSSTPGALPEKAKRIDEFATFENLNILLAEDNKINQMVAKKIMQRWNINITVVGNGKEALEAVEKNDFQLVFMDLDMPEMDGYEATAAIREKNMKIPVVALTAASFENMQQSLFSKGFSDFVQKPFDPKELHKKISMLTK